MPWTSQSMILLMMRARTSVFPTWRFRRSSSSRRPGRSRRAAPRRPAAHPERSLPRAAVPHSTPSRWHRQTWAGSARRWSPRMRRRRLGLQQGWRGRPLQLPSGSSDDWVRGQYVGPRLFRAVGEGVAPRGSGLPGGPQQHLVDGETSWSGHDERDDLGDVLGSDLGLVIELPDAASGLLMRDVGGQLGGDDTRLDEGDAYVGQQLLAQRFRPAVEAPFGGGVDAVPGAGGAPGDGGDVDDVAAAVLQLVEEHLRGGDRTQQIDLDHAPVVLALLGGEGAEQHDAGVVDQDVHAAQLLPHPLRAAKRASRSVTSAAMARVP